MRLSIKLLLLSVLDMAGEIFLWQRFLDLFFCDVLAWQREERVRVRVCACVRVRVCVRARACVRACVSSEACMRQQLD
jgi:hypothetical protein